MRRPLRRGQPADIPATDVSPRAYRHGAIRPGWSDGDQQRVLGRKAVRDRLDTARHRGIDGAAAAGAALESVSRSGDLAVLRQGRHPRAACPIGGSGTRDLLDQVRDADWTPDGSWPRFATKAPRTWVEYPLGKSIYEQTDDIHQRRSCVSRWRAHRGDRAGCVSAEGQWLSIIDRDWSGHQAVAEVGIERRWTASPGRRMDARSGSRRPKTSGCARRSTR